MLEKNYKDKFLVSRLRKEEVLEVIERMRYLKKLKVNVRVEKFMTEKYVFICNFKNDLESWWGVYV